MKCLQTWLVVSKQDQSTQFPAQWLTTATKQSINTRFVNKKNTKEQATDFKSDSKLCSSSLTHLICSVKQPHSRLCPLQIHNDDGVWLRLNHQTIAQYCASVHGEAWCLQYNQHLGKTLLLPVEEPKSILDQVIKDTILRNKPDVACGDGRGSPAAGLGDYTVVKCGASGHNVRSRPSLKAPPVGMLVLGNQISVSDQV